MTQNPVIKLAIVDDETLIVTLLSSFFQKKEEYDVIFKAESAEECLAYFSNAENPVPDVLLLDIKMKGKSGIDILPDIKALYPQLNVVVMSSHYKKSFTGFMIKTGVAAFLPKGISPFKLDEIIQEIYAKGFYFLPEQLEIVRKQISSKSPRPVVESKEKLSERELEVLKLICRQKTAQEIGEQLFITKRTVEGHKSHIFTKTGTKNIAGLVIYALQNNLIDLDNFGLD